MTEIFFMVFEEAQYIYRDSNEKQLVGYAYIWYVYIWKGREGRARNAHYIFPARRSLAVFLFSVIRISNPMLLSLYLLPLMECKQFQYQIKSLFIWWMPKMSFILVKFKTYRWLLGEGEGKKERGRTRLKKKKKSIYEA